MSAALQLLAAEVDRLQALLAAADARLDAIRTARDRGFGEDYMLGVALGHTYSTLAKGAASQREERPSGAREGT